MSNILTYVNIVNIDQRFLCYTRWSVDWTWALTDVHWCVWSQLMRILVFAWLAQFVSLHIRSMWETIYDAQAGLCTHSSNSKICVQILQKAPFWNFRPESPPPPNEKLQIWDDQSLLWNTPPMINFRFEMTKVYSWIPPLQQKWKTSDLRSLLQNTPSPIGSESGRSYVETKSVSPVDTI